MPLTSSKFPALVSTGVIGRYPSLLLLVIVTLQNVLPECETPHPMRAYDLGRIVLELLQAKVDEWRLMGPMRRWTTRPDAPC